MTESRFSLRCLLSSGARHQPCYYELCCGQVCMSRNWMPLTNSWICCLLTVMCMNMEVDLPPGWVWDHGSVFFIPNLFKLFKAGLELML